MLIKFVLMIQWIMLAKARSDIIAKRVASSAPTEHIPRLLLCSGLPKASLLGMLERLGHLGESSEDKTATYEGLLNPADGNKWDIGRMGSKRDISLRLYGRISAYVRQLEPHEKVSSAFVDWLRGFCFKSNGDESSEVKQSNEALLQSTSVASSLLTVLRNTSEDKVDSSASVSPDAPVISWKASSQEDQCHQFSDSMIRKCLEVGNIVVITDYLQTLAKLQNASAMEPTCFILEQYNSLSFFQNSLVPAILKWIPYISASEGSPRLWKLIFSPASKRPFAESLLTNCWAAWTDQHKASCKEWILRVFSTDTKSIELDTGLVSKCLILSPDMEEQHTRVCSKISLVSLQGDTLGQRYGMKLGLQIGNRSKQDFQMICSEALKSSHPSLSELLLRLYLVRPGWMNLGVAQIRTVLMDSSATLAKQWGQWNSSMDDRIDAMIGNLMSGSLRVANSLCDVAKRHPLILLRKASTLIDALLHDGLLTRNSEAAMRGAVHGSGMQGSRPVKLSGTVVQVTIRHWGYSYNEPVWVAILDVLSTCPREVLFGCGLKVGFLHVLNVYLQLLSIQLQLLSTDKTKRLKGKLSELFEALKKHNATGWHDWLDSPLEDRQVRHVLISCSFITPPQAIESLPK